MALVIGVNGSPRKGGKRKKKREPDFPLDCRGAFEIGNDLVES
jgi:hypothetical protein